VIYGLQLIYDTPCKVVEFDLTEGQYGALHTAGPEAFLAISQAARGALSESGINPVGALAVSLHTRQITKAAPGNTIVEAEESIRWEELDNPVGGEARIVAPALKKTILDTQRRQYWELLKAARISWQTGQ
jgi:hypothetical protein